MGILTPILFTTILALLLGCQKPPQAALDHARAAVDSAAHAGALRYAETPYRAAEVLMKNGWMEMARQKGRLAPFRNFKLADSLLAQALFKASEAERLAKERQLNLEILALNEISELRTEVMNWREALNGALLLLHAERYWSAAEMGLSISKRLLDEKEYEASIQMVESSRDTLRALGRILADYANAEAHNHSLWNRWVQETIAESQTQGSFALLVNKTAHKAYLLKGGKLFHTYECELGYNSARQKLFQGDGATPEGRYRVVTERARGSKYYKALLLDYPNAADRRRFQENKAKGVISRRAGIGKNIEIHGEGGRQQDWTEGCVALTNKDMDHLLKYVGVGTPVTIVRRSDNFP